MEGVCGTELYSRWCNLKDALGFTEETDFIKWILDFFEEQGRNLNETVRSLRDREEKNGSDRAAVDSKSHKRDASTCTDNVNDYSIRTSPSTFSVISTANRNVKVIFYKDEKVLAAGSSSRGGEKYPLPKNKKQARNRPKLNITSPASKSAQTKTDQTKPKRHSCQLCDAKFYKPRLLRQHVKCVHDQVRDLICGFCGQGFARRDRLKEHMRRCKHRLSEQPKDAETSASSRPKLSGCKVMCGWCHRTFISVYHLSRHVAGTHEKKPPSCAQCGKTFSRSSHMASHMKSQHEAHDLTCEFCDATFPRRNQLARHVKSCRSKPGPNPKSVATD